MEEVYFNSKLKKDCNGCGICALICPAKAIEMKEDEEGFLYPIVNESKCIHCDKCKKYCGNINEKTEKNEIYTKK